MATMQNGRGGQVGDEQSLGELVATATRDVSLLVRQEIELAKVELKQQAVSAGLGAGFLVVAGALGFFALMAITIAIGEGLASAGLARGWAFLVTAGIFLVIAGLLALFAKNRFSRLKPPERTIATVKEDLALVKKKPGSGDRAAAAPPAVR